MKHCLPPLLVLLLFLAILKNPGLCIQAASDGLKLWYNQVLPALLPSMILTSLIIRSNLLSSLLTDIPLISKLPIVRLLPLVSGMFCGYPVGAKVCRDLYDAGSLTRQDIRRLNCVVHSPSPMFMLGFVSTICFPGINARRLLLAVWFPILFLIPLSHFIVPAEQTDSASVVSHRVTFSMELFDGVYNQSVQILIKVAGYLMFFTIINRLLLYLFPQITCILLPLSGMLEMTYGIRMASESQISVRLAETLSVFFLGFGGISTMLQIRDTLPKGLFHPLSYLLFRLLHGILSAVIWHIAGI